MKDIKKRVITGIVIFVVFAAIILLALKVHWAFFDAFIVFLALIASGEMCAAISKRFPKPLTVIVSITVVLGYIAYMIAQTVVNIGGITSFYSVVLVMCLIAIVFSLCSKKVGTNNVVSTMFVLVYPVSALMYLLGFNHFPAPYRSDVLLILFVSAPLTDTFAYFVGSIVKGKKLCPRISPNKTISGAIGGLIGGTLGGVLMYFISGTAVGEFLGMGALMTGPGNYINFICMGLLCSVTTQIGDIFASYIKRVVGIKDYGNLLPGHGGVMDRIDGLIMGGIFLFLYASILMAI